MEQQELQLRHYLEVLWRGKWLILLTTLIALGGVVAFTSQQSQPPRSYQATATIMVEPREPLPVVAGTSPAADGDRSMNTQILLINSRNVMERALAKLNAVEGTETPGYSESEVNALQSVIAVRSIPQTNLLQVQARGTTTRLAEQRANAIVEAYMDYMKAERIKAIEEALLNINSQLHTTGTSGELDARAAVALPRLGTELEQVVRLVEKSVQDLDQVKSGNEVSSRESQPGIETPHIEDMLYELQGISQELQTIQAKLVRQDPQGDLLLLNREAPRIERLIADLTALSEDLRKSEERLQSLQQNPHQLRTLLQLEATHVRAAISDLTAAAQPLNRLQSQGQALSSPQMLGGVITGAKNVETSLRSISQDLGQVQTNTPEAAAQLAGARSYITSVAEYLRTTAGRLENPPANSPELNEAEIILMQNQMLGRVRGLELATRDLANIATPNLGANSRTELYTAEIRLRAATNQLNELATELAGKAGATSLYTNLAEIKFRLEEGHRGLESISKNLEGLSASAGMQAVRNAADTARTEANAVALSLDIAIRMLSIQSLRADPVTEAQLRALDRQLGDTQRKVEGIRARLGSIAESSQVSVADSLIVIRGQVRASADSLVTVRQEIQAQGNAGSRPVSEVLSRAQIETSNIAFSLDIASQQIQSILGPLTAGELGPLAERLSAGQRSAKGISERLSSDAQEADIALADSLATIQVRVQGNADILQETLENLQVNSHLLSANPNSDMAIQAYMGASNVALSLDIASRQFTGLVNNNTDPLLGGELSSLSERLTTARNRSKAISELLESTLGVGRAGESAGEVALVQNRLASSAGILKAAAAGHEQLPNASIDGSLRDIVALTKERADIGAAILRRVTEDLGRFQANETDPIRYGQLVVAEDRVRDATARVTVISSQLDQLLGRTGPGYEQLLQLHQQLELSRLSPQNTGITVVDSAVVREAAGGSRAGSLLSRRRFQFPLGAIAGMLVGVLAVFMREQVDQRVRTQRDLRDRAGVTPLGVIPKGRAPAGQLPMVASHGQSMFSEALQLVGTALESSLGKEARHVVITSTEAMEGKTMTAVNLAYVLANYGRRVLLVDGNLRKPDVAAALQLPEADGLSRALELGRNPAEYIVEAGVFNDQPFSVLPAGRPAANPAELLASSEMKAFLQQVKQQYDTVLIDCPPQVGFAETKALAKELGNAILVVKAGSTTTDAIIESKEDLESVGAGVVGAVLNFAPAAECSHLKHDRYGSREQRGGLWAGRGSRPLVNRPPERRQ